MKSLKQQLKDYEFSIVAKLLQENKGDINLTAKTLQTTSVTIYTLMRLYKSPIREFTPLNISNVIDVIIKNKGHLGKSAESIGVHISTLSAILKKNRVSLPLLKFSCKPQTKKLIKKEIK
jgi:hypothetical protein